MNIALVVVVSLAFPFLWATAFTDRNSLRQAARLKDLISEILLFIGEWEGDKLTLFKILILKGHPANLSNCLRLIRGYPIVRFVARLPSKKSIQRASTLLEEFCECVWESGPGFRMRAEVMAQDLKRLLR